jgi:hypothetical protein
MIECPNCEKTSSGSSCRLCGWSATPARKVPETHAPATLPSYPEPTAEDAALIRAEQARWRALLGMPAKSRGDESERALHPSRLGLAIDPAIRADLARRDTSGRPVPVGAILRRQKT